MLFKGGQAMNAYYGTVKTILDTPTHKIVKELMKLFPKAESGQVNSWHNFINDLKKSTAFQKLHPYCIVIIEYDLPAEGMGIDCILAGYDFNKNKVAVLIEAKQWGDEYIEENKFETYRAPGCLLHPQVQIDKHKNCFRDYLNIGQAYRVFPTVYVENATDKGVCSLISKNPYKEARTIPVYNDLNKLIEAKASIIQYSSIEIVKDFSNAVYHPSKSVLTAVQNAVSREIPFILTEEQLPVYEQIINSIIEGKKVIRINASAGAGKTALLLNLFASILKRRDENVFPIFVPGAQNTRYYKNKFPKMGNCFTYSFVVTDMIEQNKGKHIIVMMDEAQHNAPNVIKKIVESGATLIVCYDEKQSVTANNSINDLQELEDKDFFVSLELKNSVRFNGSQEADYNIRRFLGGKSNYAKDDRFEFLTFTKLEEFQNKIYQVIADNPNSSVAVMGLLCHDIKDYTYPKCRESKFVYEWKNEGIKNAETCYVDYVERKNYLNENNGFIRVGTWWAPGLDFDYVGIIIGGDGIITSNGFMGVAEKSKHYKMMVDIATKDMNLPLDIKEDDPMWTSAKKVLAYVNAKGNEEIQKEFRSLFTSYLRHVYYVMMTRGKRGCYVCYTDCSKYI